MLLAADTRPPAPIVYEPKTPTTTVTVLLHGRCNVPEKTCATFAPAVTKHSWLVCPAGPQKCSNGERTWAFNTKEVVTEALLEARKAHPELSPDPVVMGYSLGAYRLAPLIGDYPKMLLIGAKVDPSLTKISNTRLVLVAGELDQTNPYMRKQAKVFSRQGKDVRFYSLGNVGHYLTPTFPERLDPALEYLYGP